MEAVQFAYQSTNRLTVVISDEYGAPVTDAVVTVTMLDEKGETLKGVSWPQTLVNPTVLPPIPLDGPDPELGQTYTIVFPESLELDLKDPAFAVITSVSPTAGARRIRRLVTTTDQ